ncbi:MAG: SRPBCC family protein [Acidimicrobiales bacterium]
MVYTQGRGEQRGGIEMQGYVLSVEHNIPSPPEPIFAVLADAAKHTLIDGSGMLQGARDLEPERLTLGSKFGMGMKLGVRYSTVNKVVEFDENRLIAWQTGPEGLAGRLMGGRIWRYELEPGAEGTLVRESWDITPDPMRSLLKLGDIYSNKTKRDMERTLDRLAQLMAGQGAGT